MLIFFVALAGCKKSPPAPSVVADAASPPAAKEEKPIQKPRALNADEKKQLAAALKEGRGAMKKSDHPKAIAAFERALTIQPDDPASLSELGWALFSDGKLDRAAEVTHRAISASATLPGNQLMAASCYNLGRIDEARGLKQDAISEYVQSLKLRPTRTVREQLAKLDPAAAAEADPVKPVATNGPFPSLAALCDSLGDDNKDHTRCPNPGRVPEELESPKAPWLAAKIIADADDMTCHLVLQLAAGWFVMADGFECHEPGHLDFTVSDFSLLERPGFSPMVDLTTTSERSQREDVELEDDKGEKYTGRAMVTTGCDEDYYACGVGASGTPSCMHLFSGHGKEECGTWVWELTPVFGNGTMDVTSTGKPDADAKGMLGKRPFKFL
jgi:hypothetical protein